MEHTRQNKLFYSLRLVTWVIAVFCFCPKPVHAVSLEWERNSESTVVGYHLFFGRQSRVYDSIIDVGNMTLAKIPPLQNGQTYFFAVTAYDSQGLESELSEEVSYTPQSVNSIPVAQPDIYSTTKNVALNVASGAGVLANDISGDSDILSAILVSETASGIFSFNVNGAFSYLPINDFVGSDAFTYRVTDGKGTSDVVTATITVTPRPNMIPLARVDSFSITKNMTLAVAAADGLLKNDTDGDGDTLSVIRVAAPAQGQLTLSSNGGFIYSPRANFSGPDSFSYRATDGQSLSTVTLVTITVSDGPILNSIPVANADTYFTTRNQDLVVISTVGVLANDTDGDDDSLTAQLFALPAHGEVVLMADGAFVYRPSTNHTGADVFSYRITDGKTNSGVADVFITITEEGGCFECLVPLRRLLASRSNMLAEALASPTFVPTNSTCLEMELLNFYTVTRQIRIAGDAEISAVLESAVQCLTWQVRQSVTGRSAQVGGLLKSSWSAAASNRLEQIRKKLDQVEALADPLTCVRALIKSMSSLRQVDGYVQTGSVAPASISNRTITCKFVYDGHSFSGKFHFDGTNFVFESVASGMPQTGSYLFTRTTWNSGLLNFTLNGPLEISMPLKFTGTRGRISGRNIHGTFLME